MSTKHALIGVPLLVLALLLQSYFWVPSYDSQAVGNADRLTKFIIGSIGDAQILNPILLSDTSSGEIADLVFDGLLRLDDKGELEGRLAESWTITETAYLLVDERASFPDGTPVTAEALVARIQAFIASPQGKDLGAIVSEVSSTPAESTPLAAAVGDSEPRCIAQRADTDARQDQARARRSGPVDAPRPRDRAL